MDELVGLVVKYALISATGIPIGAGIFSWMLAAGRSMIVSSVISSVITQAILFVPQKWLAFNDPIMDLHTVGWQLLCYSTLFLILLRVEALMIQASIERLGKSKLVSWGGTHTILGVVKFAICHTLIFR